MKLLTGAAVGTTALALAVVPALAANMVDATVTNQAVVPVVNGSFEDAATAYVDGGSGFMPNVAGPTIPDWNVSAGDVDWIGSYWQAADGSYSIDLNGSQPGTISTQLATTAGATYYVQFALSGNPAGGPADKTGTVDAAGGTPQPFTYTLSSGNTDPSLNNSVDNMLWATQGYEFTADSTSATLTFTSTTSGAFGPALDNVTLTRILGSGADCKSGGWEIYQALGADNTLISFRNQGQCVSHFARSGDVPIGSQKSAPKQNTDTTTQGPGAQCKNGGWMTLQVTDSQGNPVLDSQGNPATFRNQGQCVSYFARGGSSLTGPQSHAPKQKAPKEKAPKQKNGKY